jgi:hypothetical protein
MATIGFIKVAKNEVFTSAHVESDSRSKLGYFVISGCDVHQAASPSMGIVIDSGIVQFGWGTTPLAVAGGALTLDNSDPSLPRVAIIYIDGNAAGQKYEGTPAIIDPSTQTAYPKRWASPAPGDSIPNGVIIARVFVGAGVTTILNASIDDMACAGTSFVQGPTTATTAGKMPVWSSTPGTLVDGKTAPAGDIIGSYDAQHLTYKTFDDAPTLDLAAKIKQIATPVAPATGYTLLYAKTDGKIYIVPAGGTESAVGVGNVIGPANNSDNYVPQWNGADSKTLKAGLAVGTGANNLLQLDANSKIPAVDGTQITGVVLSPATNNDNYVPQWDGVNARKLKNGFGVGTSAYNLVQLNTSAQLPAVSGELLTNVLKGKIFTVGYKFGNAAAVIPENLEEEWEIPVACTITKTHIREIHDTVGYITCTLYIRHSGGSAGSALDQYVITNDNWYDENLAAPITVAAGDYVRIKVTGITALTQILCSLTMSIS